MVGTSPSFLERGGAGDQMHVKILFVGDRYSWREERILTFLGTSLGRANRRQKQGWRNQRLGQGLELNGVRKDKRQGVVKFEVSNRNTRFRNTRNSVTREGDDSASSSPSIDRTATG